MSTREQRGYQMFPVLDGARLRRLCASPAARSGISRRARCSIGGRDDAGEVRMADGSIYNPTKRGEVAAIDYDDMEFHIVFHDLPGPGITNNFPPPVSFFYHIMFEDVQVQIKHSE
jgi:hypothetical protein